MEKLMGLLDFIWMAMFISIQFIVGIWIGFIFVCLPMYLYGAWQDFTKWLNTWRQRENARNKIK